MRSDVGGLVSHFERGGAEDEPAGDDHLALAPHVCLPVVDPQVMGTVDLEDYHGAIGEVPLSVEETLAARGVASLLTSQRVRRR
ncbi:MAG TPA: hypothetical protein VFI30_00830 [Nocardioidaceae bacterium]|nr:hypothetical protein [Nocardioidaceae bacterium]